MCNSSVQSTGDEQRNWYFLYTTTAKQKWQISYLYKIVVIL